MKDDLDRVKSELRKSATFAEITVSSRGRNLKPWFNLEENEVTKAVEEAENALRKKRLSDFLGKVFQIFRSDKTRRIVSLSILTALIGFVVAIVGFASNIAQILDYFGVKITAKERVCVVRETGAGVFDKLMIIPVASDAKLMLPPNSKVYVTDEVNSLPFYEISKIEVDLGPEGVELGPVTVAEVSPNSPAERAGILRGDIVIAVDGIDADTQDFVREYISEHLERSITMQIQRVEQIIVVEVTPTIMDGIPKIGVAFEGGRPTSITKMPFHGYVPTFAVDCNP